MKFQYLICFASLVIFSSCTSYFNKVIKSPDVDFKYETAKQYFFTEKNSNVNFLLTDVMPAIKGTQNAEEATFVEAMSQYQAKDYETANSFFKKYLVNYPMGSHTSEARFYSAMSYYMDTPQVELDQTNTYKAISEFQNFIELEGDSKFIPKVHDLIFELQDKLVEKEYQAAKLYYNLGNYFGNCTMGGNNFEACIITAENAVREYPYSSRKEDFNIMILKAKYYLAKGSIAEKKKERIENTLDEYYGFINEYPDSKYKQVADNIYNRIKKALDDPNLIDTQSTESFEK